MNWVIGIRILGNLACLFVLFLWTYVLMMIKVLKGLNFPCEYFVNLQPDIHQFRISKGARFFFIDDQICPNS